MTQGIAATPDKIRNSEKPTIYRHNPALFTNLRRVKGAAAPASKNPRRANA
jgi:hypothetical protein